MFVPARDEEKSRGRQTIPTHSHAHAVAGLNCTQACPSFGDCGRFPCPKSVLIQVEPRIRAFCRTSADPRVRIETPARTAAPDEINHRISPGSLQPMCQSCITARATFGSGVRMCFQAGADHHNHHQSISEESISRNGLKEVSTKRSPVITRRMKSALRTSLPISVLAGPVKHDSLARPEKQVRSLAPLDVSFTLN